MNHLRVDDSYEISSLIYHDNQERGQNWSSAAAQLWLVRYLSAFGVIYMLFMSSPDFFKIKYSQISSKNTIRVSNGLDPDQDRHFVGPDLGPNCLQRFSADDKNRH